MQIYGILYINRMMNTIIKTIERINRQSEDSGIPYQTLINLYLSDCAKQKNSYRCLGNKTDRVVDVTALSSSDIIFVPFLVPVPIPTTRQTLQSSSALPVS